MTSITKQRPLFMPLDVADHLADVGAMAALMLGGGYTLSALGPFVLGLFETPPARSHSRCG